MSKVYKKIDSSEVSYSNDTETESYSLKEKMEQFEKDLNDVTSLEELIHSEHAEINILITDLGKYLTRLAKFEYYKFDMAEEKYTDSGMQDRYDELLTTMVNIMTKNYILAKRLGMYDDLNKRIKKNINSKAKRFREQSLLDIDNNIDFKELADARSAIKHKSDE